MGCGASSDWQRECFISGLDFFADGHLVRRQKGFNQGAVAADGHRGETFEPVSGWNFRISVEPGCQRLEGIRADAALFDPQQQMSKECARNVFALNLWHQEPA